MVRRWIEEEEIIVWLVLEHSRWWFGDLKRRSIDLKISFNINKDWENLERKINEREVRSGKKEKQEEILGQG